MKFKNKDTFIVGLLVLVIVLAAFLFFERRHQPPIVYEAPGTTDSGGRTTDATAYQKLQVKNTVDKHTNDVQACYKAYLETKPSITDGFVYVDWQVKPDGEVVKPELVSSQFGNPTFEKCVVEAIPHWSFPPTPTGRTEYANFKFHFKKTEEGQ